MIPQHQHDEFRALWLDPTTTVGYIREFLRTSATKVIETQKFLGLPDKACPREAWEPTEAEIEQRREQCRSWWGKDCERARRSSHSVQPVTVRSFRYDRRTMSFS